MAIKSALLAASALPTLIAASGAYHTASYYVSYVTSYKGNLIVPPRIPSGGTPYVWPGLEPPSYDGVLQTVLDGRNQHWYFDNAYVGSPSEPEGGGVDTGVNQKLTFSMVETPVGSGNWAIEVENPAGNTASYTYNIGIRMNQALFAVELYNNSWDFGNVVFENVEIVAETTETSWCTANPQYSDVTIDFQGVSSSTNGGYVTCNVEKVTLSPP